MRRVLPAALVVLGLSACDPQRVEETAVEEFRFEAGSERPRIEVRIEEGSIGIQGAEGAVTGGGSPDAKGEAATDDGNIELEGIFTRLDTVTSDGSIRIDCLDWRGSTEGWGGGAAGGGVPGPSPPPRAAGR